MRLHRPALAALAAATFLPLTSPAFGAVTTPAAGAANSSATLAKLTAVGHTLSVGTLAAIAQTLTSAAPTISFVPVTVDGTKIGEVVVDPSTSPRTVGGVVAPGLPAGVLSATSPSAELKAARPSTGPTSSLVANLGSASLLGVPMTLDGGVNVGSATTGSQAAAQKSVAIQRVALPSVADLLAKLGLDVLALPAETLNGLLSQLPVTVSDATSAAIDAANQALVPVQEAAADAHELVDEQEVVVGDFVAAVADAQADFAAELAEIPLMDETNWNALPDAVKQTHADAYAAWQDLQEAASDLAAENLELDGLEDDLDAALDALADATGELASLVAGVLDTISLAEIGATNVSSKAIAGAGKAASITGTVSGLKVLGQDVFAAVFGTSSLDVSHLLDTGAGTVNSALASVTAALSSVLSTATGATGLVVPAPVVEVMKKTTGTGVDGAFGTADATVTVLSISLGSLTIPTAYALPDAASLPGVTPTATGFTTAPLSVQVGMLVEAARFRPATGTSTPGGGGSSDLPATGAPLGLAILAAVAAAGAVGTRRLAHAAR